MYEPKASILLFIGLQLSLYLSKTYKRIATPPVRQLSREAKLGDLAKQ